MESGNTSTPFVLIKRSAGAMKGSDSSYVSHVITCNSHVIRRVCTIDQDPKKKGINQETEVVLVEDETDEDESTAGEEGTVESSVTDDLLDPIDPIDFIETNPRLSHTLTYQHPTGKKESYRDENWNGFVNDNELDELAKKNKILKRSKLPRGGKVDRQRPPHTLPRLNKMKTQHMRPSPASRKRRLSGRMARPSQLSNASEEGDMAQADEMGDGEGKDDGFVDCQEGVRKRNRKKTVGVHMIFPNTSPPSSPSNTPLSRRKATSRKSRPKPRTRKPNKLQLASADISTQESTTQGPGSSDTSEEGVSPTEGTMLKTNEEIIDSDSENDYEDARSLTPFLHESPVQTSATPPSNSLIPVHPVAPNHLLHNLDQVSDISNPLSVTSKNPRDHSEPRSVAHTRDTNPSLVNGALHKWKTKRIESDLSTAPFSSETSDMDTSGNERLFKTDSSIGGQNRTPRYDLKSSHILSSINHRSPVQHRLINSGSSGDEVTPKTRDVKVVPRLPPKPGTLQSGTNKSAQPPPPPKKPLHLVKSSPLSQKVGHESPLIPSSKPPSGTSRSKPVKGTPKLKPPVAVKPKIEVKPHPPLPNPELREVRPQSDPDLSVGENTSQTSLTSEARSSASPPAPRVSSLPPPVSRRVSKLSAGGEKNLQSSVTPPVSAKQSVQAKPVSQATGKASQQMSKCQTQNETKNVSLHVKPASATNSYEDTSKTSSSEAQSSPSQSNSPHQSPAATKRTLPLSKSLAHVSPPVKSGSSESINPVINSSQSSPILFSVGPKSDQAPQKPPKDLNKRKSYLLLSTTNSQTNLLQLSSHSPSVDPPRTNGVVSPPPLPPRSRDSQVFITPSAVDSNSQSCDDKPLPPPVPAHRNSSRLSLLNESLTQVNNSEENHSVNNISPELPTERHCIRSKQPVANRNSLPFTNVQEDAAPTRSHRSKTPDSVLDNSSAVATDIKKSPQLERVMDLKLKKKLSSARRVPPKPPTHSTPSESSGVIREEQHSAEVSDRPPLSPPPPVPFRSSAHVTNAHSEPSMLPSIRSSPNLGGDRRSIPNLVSNGVRKSPNFSRDHRSIPNLVSHNVNSPGIRPDEGKEKHAIPSLASNNVSQDPPKKIYTRARRDYEEIDLLDDCETNHCGREKIVPEPKRPVRPLRRDYEEIDLFDDSVSDTSHVLVPSLSAGASVSSSQDPVSPITMVAVIRQTNSSDFKIDPTVKPKLPLEDLRENWTTSPQLTRRRLSKSFSAKRGHSLVFNKSSSVQFEQKVRTLDPTIIRTSVQRTPSLDDLDDRMDRSTQNSMHRQECSSDDDETNTISPIQPAELPRLPADPLYSSPKPATESSRKLEKTFGPNTEPLYQYINTAEFLRESTAYEGDAVKMTGSVNTRKLSQLEVARQLFQGRLWCEQPDIIASGLLDVLSEEERKLQEAMYEVITTEVTYLRSLDVLIEHFMEDPGMNPNLPEGRRVMDKRQHHVIFSNVKEVREVSSHFLEALQKRQKECAEVKNISDIVLDYAENKFDCYVRYCTNQVYQTREMQDCLETSVMFRDYLRRLETDKICQNLNMQSFLLLPMQRITRLPLLVLAILNRTHLGHKDHHTVERTLRTVQKLVTMCNDGARKMDRTEQLVEIHQKMDFGKLKPFPIVSASRQLERKGTLIELQVEQKLLGKLKIKKTPHYVFVFTDYVIITKKKKDAKGDQYYKVVDHTSRALVDVEWIESHHAVNFEKKVFEEADSVARATWAVAQAGAKHAFLLIFLANAYQRCAKYILLAQNDTDKTRWMESMERQDVQKDEEKIYQMWDCPQVQAIFDYHAKQPDELDLERGDVVKVYRKMADGWYEGERLRDLRCGWFPSNFCIEVENEHTRARNLRETRRLMSLSLSSDLIRSAVQTSK